MKLTQAQNAPKIKMTTDIPAEILTPATIKTRLGTLNFFDGLPDNATVERVYDNLDFIRGVDVFLNALSAASLRANIEGLKSVGGDYQQRVDAKTLLLRPGGPAILNCLSDWKVPR